MNVDMSVQEVVLITIGIVVAYLFLAFGVVIPFTERLTKRSCPKPVFPDEYFNPSDFERATGIKLNESTAVWWWNMGHQDWCLYQLGYVDPDDWENLVVVAIPWQSAPPKNRVEGVAL